MWRGLVIAFLLTCSQAWGQIAFNAAADLTNNGGTTNSLTHSYTVSSGANRILYVALLGDTIGGNDDITGVTYAGVSMTLITKVVTGNVGANRFQYLYRLLRSCHRREQRGHQLHK